MNQINITSNRRLIRRATKRSFFMLSLLTALLACLLLASRCTPAKKTTNHQSNPKQSSITSIQALINGGDTTALKNALAGNWKLDRICHSSFVGLSCDSSLKQQWHIDSLGGILWETDGQGSTSIIPDVKDQFHFVAHSGARAGSSKTASVWTLFLKETRRAYIIQKLNADSLQLADFPLIMDKTTTYYLHK